jgi:hypothetical protein
MYTVKNNQNLDFTGSSKTNPYGLIQYPYRQKGGKTKKSKKSKNSRKSIKSRKSRKSRK